MNEINKSFEIMKKHGMEKLERTVEPDTTEVEISYAGFFGKMPRNEAEEMMREIWKDNPRAMFIVDGVCIGVEGVGYVRAAL